MKKIVNSLLLIVLPLIMGGCEVEPTNEGGGAQAQYGEYVFGEERVAVRSYITVEDTQLLLKISPLSDALTATTYAIIGVHTNLLGKELDVEYRFHNDDYIFVYEDPMYYYSTYRPLKSGGIMMQRNRAGKLDVEVDVVLYDGTPFRYSAKGLSIIPNN